MGRIIGRILRRIGRFIHGFFSIGISLRAVLVLLVLVGGGMYFWTYNSMLKQVGGKEDYDEAMRYIEIKDLLDERFIDPVDRKAMGESAAAAMVSGLGDSWSYFMTADEYRETAGRMVTFEYTLLAGVNDAPADAAELGKLSRRHHAKINLIPFNETDSRFRRPERRVIEAFAAEVERNGGHVTVRRERGGGENAACGQLRRAGAGTAHF